MFLITSRLLRATLPANAPRLGQLLYYGWDGGRDSDWSAVRFRYGRHRLLHVAHSPRHPRLLDAYARSFRCRAIPDLGRADTMSWPSAWPIGLVLGLSGLAGLAYQIHVIRMRHKVGLVLLDRYDWLPYAGVPALGNACLIAGAAGLIEGKSFAPYAIAGANSLLLFAGVYGAWDITLWIVKNREKTSATRRKDGKQRFYSSVRRFPSDVLKKVTECYRQHRAPYQTGRSPRLLPGPHFKKRRSQLSHR